MAINLLERVAGNIEKRIIGGETWATKRMSFKDRLCYFQNTGLWPGLHTEDADRMFLESDIESAKDPVCRKIKIETARRAGFK